MVAEANSVVAEAGFVNADESFMMAEANSMVAEGNFIIAETSFIVAGARFVNAEGSIMIADGRFVLSLWSIFLCLLCFESDAADLFVFGACGAEDGFYINFYFLCYVAEIVGVGVEDFVSLYAGVGDGGIGVCHVIVGGVHIGKES